MNELVGKRDKVSNYYTVKFGKVVKDLGKEEPSNMEGVTKRVNKNGETVYEIVSDYIRGKIIKLELQPPPEDKPNYKDQMNITLKGDGGVKAVVRVPFDSAYGRGFLLAAEGIDFSHELELEPYKYTDKKSGKEKMGLSVFQFGEQLPWTMGTKANPGNVPKLEKVMFKGEEVWDNSKQLEFFKDFFATLADKLEESEEMSSVEFTPEEEEEDLLF